MKMNLRDALNSEEIANKFETISSLDDAIRILKEYGVDTTEEELTALFPGEDGELTDENLENVAGGSSWFASLPVAVFSLWKKITRNSHSGFGHSGGGRKG